MEMKEAVTTCFKKYADTKGRATRSEFWWFALAQLLILMAASMIGDTIAGLATLALLLPSVAVAARRLHDTGRSAWWLLINLVPLLSLIFLYWAVQPSQEGSNQYDVAQTP